MKLLAIPSPDLTSISIGTPTLQLLEAADFSTDGGLLLVKAVYTDTAVSGQHYGLWLFDLGSRVYVQNLTAQWRDSDPSPAGSTLVEARILGTSDSYEILAKASTLGLEPQERLVSFDADGVQVPDVLAQLLGPDVAARIERFAASDDGRFVALQTDAPNLLSEVQVDTNGVSDILLLDRQTHAVTRVSAVGASEVFDPVHLGSLRTDGDRIEIAFVTAAAFLTSDRNGSASEAQDKLDAYLWSSSFDSSGLVGSSTFTLVSRRPDGSAAGGVPVPNQYPVVTTASGVYFTSASSEMTSGDTNGASDVFRAVQSPSGQPIVERIALAGTTELATGMWLLDADPDGDRVAILTDSPIASVHEGLYQALIVDVPSGAWHLASRTESGEAGDDLVINGILGPTSNTLAFTSAALNLARFDPVAFQGSLYLSTFNTQANVAARFWAGREPIVDATIQTGDGTRQTQTGPDGLGTLQDIGGTHLILSVQKAVTPAEATTASRAVTLQDAVSILRMIASQETSANSPPVSRFQSLAADFDGSGTVSLADALGVLRHAVGLQAPKPSWVFVEEGDDALPTILSPGIPGPVTIDVSPAGPIEVNLIGVLRGDFDGSWDPQRHGVGGEI